MQVPVDKRSGVHEEIRSGGYFTGANDKLLALIGHSMEVLALSGLVIGFLPPL